MFAPCTLAPAGAAQSTPDRLTSGPKPLRCGNRNELNRWHWMASLSLVARPAQKSWPGRFWLEEWWAFQRLAWAGNRLAALLKCPDMLARAFRDVSHCVLFDRAICREVPKVGNSGDEAVALANEDCPVPNPAHAALPLLNKRQRWPPRRQQHSPAMVPSSQETDARVKNLTYWCVLEALSGLRSPIWPNDDRRMDTARPNGHR